MRPVVEATLPNRVPVQFAVDAEPTKVKCDPVQIRQMVMNLALNAAEASIGSKKPVSVRLFSANMSAEILAGARAGAELHPGRYAVIEVKDSGSGIESRMLDRIFDPFFTTKKTGRGLGLAAIAGIIKSHEGCILVSSTPGSGSTFSIVLPLSETPAQAKEYAKSADDYAIPKMRGTVLIIDDEEPVKLTMAHMLRTLGFTTLDASSCEEGLERLKAAGGKVDAAIIDLNMPGKDGFETYCLIRGKYPEIPMMISTGFNDKRIEEKFEGRPLAGILEKPFDRKNLAQSMQAAFPQLCRDVS
jgi:CheY-like chemotaxis protein